MLPVKPGVHTHINDVALVETHKAPLRHGNDEQEFIVVGVVVVVEVVVVNDELTAHVGPVKPETQLH